MLPGCNYNYKNYSLANYLRNNFVDHGNRGLSGPEGHLLTPGNSEKPRSKVRVSLQQYFFTGSSKVTSCVGFGRKEYSYGTSWRGFSSTKRNLP